MTCMTQGGNTMGDEPTWGELLLTFVLVMGVPTVIVGGVVFSLVGLAFWATAPERPWRR
ncbi:hypothetical protein [Streptomyces omiyaensis]|nr:hypothetical protein [Streptomyces omiyaensis]